MSNSGHDGVLLMRNFVLVPVHVKKDFSTFECRSLCSMWPAKIENFKCWHYATLSIRNFMLNNILKKSLKKCHISYSRITLKNGLQKKFSIEFLN
jgi:hypothetical protein